MPQYRKYWLKKFFEAINLLQKSHMNKNVESIYKNR